MKQLVWIVLTEMLQHKEAFFEVLRLEPPLVESQVTHQQAYLDDVSKIPLTAPNVDKATKTGIIHAMYPKRRLAKVWNIQQEFIFMLCISYFYIWFKYSFTIFGDNLNSLSTSITLVNIKKQI